MTEAGNPWSTGPRATPGDGGPSDVRVRERILNFTADHALRVGVGEAHLITPVHAIARLAINGSAAPYEVELDLLGPTGDRRVMTIRFEVEADDDVAFIDNLGEIVRRRRSTEERVPGSHGSAPATGAFDPPVDPPVAAGSRPGSSLLGLSTSAPEFAAAPEFASRPESAHAAPPEVTSRPEPAHAAEPPPAVTGPPLRADSADWVMSNPLRDTRELAGGRLLARLTDPDGTARE